jgi:hypothetical protein
MFTLSEKRAIAGAKRAAPDGRSLVLNMSLKMILRCFKPAIG